MEITGERTVMGMGITSERNVKGTDITTDITGVRSYSCLQDGNHTDGQYITLFVKKQL